MNGYFGVITHWDEAMMLSELVNISEAKVHDSKGFEQTVFSKNTIILADKGYWGFEVIKDRINAENIFVTRIKTNTVYESSIELELPEEEDQNILKDVCFF